MDRPISMGRLAAYVAQVCKSPDAAKSKTDLFTELGAVLWPGSEGPRNKFMRHVDRDDVLRFSSDKLERCVQLIHDKGRGIRPSKIISEWQPLPTESYRLPLGAAEEGEIEVLDRLSTDNLASESVRRWVGVYVDRVRFWTRFDQHHHPIATDGHYVRIETPGRQDGACVLPIDRASGDVCLVTQFRHPQRKLVTEAPRGFADPGIDYDGKATGERELDEESGLVPLDFIELKATYTDTGKLADRLGLFLAIVDREQQQARLRAKAPPLEDPVWVPLLDFYEAVFSPNEVLVRGELRFVDIGEHQRARQAKSRLAQGYLAIEDAFTIQAALLALPRLKRMFKEKFASQPGPWS